MGLSVPVLESLLQKPLYFDIYIIMKIIDALDALAALAQESRLAIFRVLVRAGPDGMKAGDIAAKLGIAGPTLSFHLKELKSAGLVSCNRDGRSMIYAADFAVMGDLIGFLTDDCCGGHPEVCALPQSSSEQERERI